MLTLLDDSASAATKPTDGPAFTAEGAPAPDYEPRSVSFYLKTALGTLAAGLAIFLFLFQPKFRSTVVTVVIAVGGSAALWIGANLLFNQVRDRWLRFSVISGAVIGALYGVILHGNNLTLGSGDGFLAWLPGPVAGAVAVGAVGYLLALADDPGRRMIIGVGGGAAIGIATGLLLRAEYYPGLDLLTTALYTFSCVVLGAGLSALRKRPPIGGALTGGAIGWLLGAWGGADLGDGNIATSMIAAAIPAVAIGARVGITRNPDYPARAAIDNRSRAWIFVGPALLFIFVMLVVPTIRTAYLSLFDRDSEAFLWLENYGEIFTRSGSFDVSNWSAMFTSRPFIVGAVLLIVALVVGARTKVKAGKAVEVGNATFFPLVIGGLLLGFGIFTALRGTIFNNLWWVITVPFFSTAIGLAVAVLADNKGGERVAKSIIFMPMAISLVGASIIWRFVYAARPVSNDQTGVLNGFWVGLGRLSTGSGMPTIIGAVVAGLVFITCLAVVARKLTRKEYAGAVMPGILSFFTGWFFARYIKLWGTGVGGMRVEDGEVVDAQTVLFLENAGLGIGPYNNVMLMVILIWIQVGFAMVILSAAIKAVPTELIEAAKIDGASDSQVFWRITLPQIATTIGVVVTTIIVLVMKVYDIVKVINNGNFGTQVLANDMFNEAFTFNNTGLGAALAILIFVAVLPIMIFNIRRMQKEEG